MKKAKKYIYPLAFSAAFLIYHIFLLFLIGKAISFPYGSYAPAALLVLFIFAWLIVALPIYCIRYSKIIIDEKLRILFSAYNALLIIVSHLLPFNLQGETTIFTHFVLWVLFWNIVPLICRLISRKIQKKGTQSPSYEEFRLASSLLLQNKTKNILAIVFTCLYILSFLTDSMFWQVFNTTSALTSALPFFSAIALLVFLWLGNKDYLFKRALFPFALAGNLVSGLLSIYRSLSSWDLQLKYNPLYPVSFALFCLTTVSLAVMLIGTLFNFKYMYLLKYGALVYIVLSAGQLIFYVISMVMSAYQQFDMVGSFAINTAPIIDSLLHILYFAGIFILTTNKRNTVPCGEGLE